MSDKELARRALPEIVFQGVNITNSIKPYLISLTYTDNEDGETDDLQIKLQDREGLWLEQWLGAAVDAAASRTTITTASTGSSYKVTAQDGLNIRSGPGTNHGRLGAFSYGTVINVLSISGGWASLKYSGKDAYVSASYIQSTSGSGSSTESVSGFRVQATILRANWEGDGKDKLLDCGQFELDSVDASGPPSEVTIKCTSLPFSAQVRQTKKNRSWEGYTLKGIAQEMANRNGMGCIYQSASNPEYSRVEQVTQSDIAFLSTLCSRAGISLKATNNILVLFDQAAYEARASVLTISKTSNRKQYEKYKLSTGAYDTKFTSCRVSYTNPSTGRVISGAAYVEDYKEDGKNNQELKINAKVGSVGEAEVLAAKHLRLKNKYAYSASFTMPGDPALVAGVTVMLTGWGPWSGKYMIKQARHSVGGSGGYTTQISLRRVLEGY